MLTVTLQKAVMGTWHSVQTTNDNEDVYLSTGATLYESVLTIIANLYDSNKKSLEYKSILRYNILSYLDMSLY